jgi:hypothetical protein
MTCTKLLALLAVTPLLLVTGCAGEGDVIPDEERDEVGTSTEALATTGTCTVSDSGHKFEAKVYGVYGPTKNHPGGWANVYIKGVKGRDESNVDISSAIYRGSKVLKTRVVDGGSLDNGVSLISFHEDYPLKRNDRLGLRFVFDDDGADPDCSVENLRVQ